MYLSAKNVCERYQISKDTLYRWRKEDRIKFKVLPSGKHVYIPFEECGFFGRQQVMYLRVSEGESHWKLINQQRAILKYLQRIGVTIDKKFSDVAGAAADRPGFLALMQEVTAERVDTVYVTDTSRFGFSGLKTLRYIFKLSGTKIVALENAPKTIRISNWKSLELNPPELP